jgi:hypothetical protein
MIRLTVDSRDKIYQNKFGAAFELPEELNLDTNLYDEAQPIGDVKCTCYTVADIAEDTTKTEFSIDDLWTRIPSNQFGANPRDVLKEAVENGLLPRGKSVRLKNWSSYYRADLGNQDPFTNVQSAMVLANSPVGVCTYWYREWQGQEILPIGKTPLNGHMYAAEGYKLIGGKPHLIIEAWTGRKHYMSREVFNAAMKPYGMQSWILSTSLIDAKREKNLIEMIRDLMLNLIIKLRGLIIEKGVEPVAPNPLDEGELSTYQEGSPVPKDRFAWGTPEQARLSARVIMDEMGLTGVVDKVTGLKAKNLLCACIQQESQFNPRAIGKPNKDGTKDYGLCQYNNGKNTKGVPYWIGGGADFKDIDEVLDNPEKNIRVMVREYKKGNLKWWASYSTGAYKKYI